MSINVEFATYLTFKLYKYNTQLVQYHSLLSLRPHTCIYNMQPAVLSFHAIKYIHFVLIDLRSLLLFDRKVLAIGRPFIRPPSAPEEPHAVRLSERDMCTRCGLTGLGQQLNCNGALPIATWSTGHNGPAGLGLLSSRKPLCI